MAKDKSLGENPAQAFHKKVKRRQINKAKAEKSKVRDDQLAKRRPDQVQRQIDNLQELKASGRMNADDQRLLTSLERDLARIVKLKASGTGAPIVTSERTAELDKKRERQNKRIPKDPTKSIYYDPTCEAADMAVHPTDRSS